MFPTVAQQIAVPVQWSPTPTPMGSSQRPADFTTTIFATTTQQPIVPWTPQRQQQWLRPRELTVTETLDTSSNPALLAPLDEFVLEQPANRSEADPEISDRSEADPETGVTINLDGGDTEADSEHEDSASNNRDEENSERRSDQQNHSDTDNDSNDDQTIINNHAGSVSDTNVDEEDDLDDLLHRVGADDVTRHSAEGAALMRELRSTTSGRTSFRDTVLRARRHLRRARDAVNRALDATDRYVTPEEEMELHDTRRGRHDHRDARDRRRPRHSSY